MIHSLFIINKQGEIIIEKHWRGRVSRSVGEKFWEEVKKQAKPEDTPPIISTAKYYLVHVYKGDLFYVGVVQTETPPLMITELLHTIVQTFEKYIGKVTDHSIKQNFVTVYQLLDEMIDNGFPITTELSLLQDLVRPPVSLVQSVTTTLEKPSQGHGRSPVPWRKLGIKYNNNEVFFDIVEELNCIIDVNGMVAFAEIIGKINVNCKLSGMPDLLMTFKDPTLIDDCTFHPCVRYARFDQDRSVSFVPPDGEFVLLTYRISGISAIPVYCRPQLNFYEGGAQVSIMAGLKQQQKPVEDVRVLIPISNAPESDSLNVSVGGVGYDAKTKMMKWDIGKLAPQSKLTPSVNGKLNFAGRALVSSPSAVHVQFKMPNSAISDIKVDSVQLKNEKYKPFKGVRYMAQSGRFEVRTC